MYSNTVPSFVGEEEQPEGGYKKMKVVGALLTYICMKREESQPLRNFLRSDHSQWRDFMMDRRSSLINSVDIKYK